MWYYPADHPIVHTFLKARVDVFADDLQQSFQDSAAIFGEFCQVCGHGGSLAGHG
jgi:hypothetical protein